MPRPMQRPMSDISRPDSVKEKGRLYALCSCKSPGRRGRFGERLLSLSDQTHQDQRIHGYPERGTQISRSKTELAQWKWETPDGQNFRDSQRQSLIVDDQESHVLLLERMLRGAGYTSIESTMDPSAVCELHRKNRYAAILLDLKMPGMDGFQVMEGLKEVDTHENFPVLVITAEPGQKLRALRAGARDFVSKPLDLPEVLIRVHNMIEVRLLRLEMDLLRAQLVDAQKHQTSVPSAI